jgi:uncharacterized protein YqhQ
VSDTMPIGGQAVIGGVMLRRGARWAVAVRRTDGSIVSQVRSVPPVRAGRWFAVRGVSSLASGLVLGTRALLFSADQQLDDGQRRSHQVPLALAAVVPVVFFAVVFMALPAALAGALTSGTGEVVLEGLLRMTAVLGYVVAIGRMEHIAETFGYHGAEHQVVNCHESGDALTVDAARRHRVRHDRCGTSFMVVTVVLASLVFAFVPDGSLGWRVGSRMLGLPVVAALSYEVLRWASSRSSVPRRLICVPGGWVQSLTVRTPRSDQLEVAVVCARALLDDAGDDVELQLTGRRGAGVPHLTSGQVADRDVDAT